MSEPTYELTDHPEPITAGEAPPADEPTYEQFYPSDPYPPMSDEDKAVHETYYPNINKETTS